MIVLYKNANDPTSTKYNWTGVTLSRAAGDGGWLAGTENIHPLESTVVLELVAGGMTVVTGLEVISVVRADKRLTASRQSTGNLFVHEPSRTVDAVNGHCQRCSEIRSTRAMGSLIIDHNTYSDKTCVHADALYCNNRIRSCKAGCLLN